MSDNIADKFLELPLSIDEFVRRYLDPSIEAYAAQLRRRGLWLRHTESHWYWRSWDLP